MLYIETTPEYTLSIEGCVRCPLMTNLVLCLQSCLTAYIMQHLILV